MRAVICLLGVLMILMVVNEHAYAQKKKSYLKKRNRMITQYRGGSIHFSKNKRYWSVGAGFSSFNYFGDLAPASSRISTDLKFTRPGFGLNLTYRYSPNLSFRGGIAWGRIRGDDFESADPHDDIAKYRYVRNLSFRNDLYEITLQGMWDIFSNYGTFLNRVPYTPYVWAGVAGFLHEPKAKAPEVDRNGNDLPQAGEWVKLRPLGTEGQASDAYEVDEYSNIQISIPVGVGIRARLNKRWDFAFELGYRFLFTDYIDDVSGKFIDLGALDSDLAKVMSDRSLEPTSAVSGEDRDAEAIRAVSRPISYVSEIDGQTYNTMAGYGKDPPMVDNDRGKPGNDHLFVTTIKVTYVLTGSFQRAKFR